MEETIFSYKQLYTFCLKVFKHIGCSHKDAAQASEVLVAADLRGIDSHGIARLSGYVRLWETKRINTQPKLSITHETLSTARIDADAALGLVAAPYAMQIAIEKATHCGSGWVSVGNSNHFGIAGFHAMMALHHDMIGIAMTNASALVAPTFAKEKLLGTNPISVAVPTGTMPPFVADLATTTAANGKLEVLQRKQASMPEGWAQTKEGYATTDANILKHGGALLPLGSNKTNGSHKGYALSSVVDIFSGILGGANFGPWVPPFPAYISMPENQPGKGIGHFFGALRIDAFQSASTFKNHMDKWIQRFKAATPINTSNPVQIPGDAERIYEKERLQKGIPLHKSEVTDLENLAKHLNLTFD